MSLIAPESVPGDERNIPLDLTGASSKTVGEIHNEFSSRSAYAIYQAAVVQSRLIEDRRALKVTKARLMAKHTGGKKYEVDALVSADEIVEKLEDRIAVDEAQLALIEGVIGAYGKITEGSSREISRRENEIKRGGGSV